MVADVDQVPALSENVVMWHSVHGCIYGHGRGLGVKGQWPLV